MTKLIFILLSGFAVNLAFAGEDGAAYHDSRVVKYVIDGAVVYNEGKPASCADCHGPDGAGYPRTRNNSRRVPPIAGLPAKTVEIFLQATKHDYVKNGIKKMHERATKLDDDEIEAVAKYVEQMHKGMGRPSRH